MKKLLVLLVMLGGCDSGSAAAVVRGHFVRVDGTPTGPIGVLRAMKGVEAAEDGSFELPVLDTFPTGFIAQFDSGEYYRFTIDKTISPGEAFDLGEILVWPLEPQCTIEDEAIVCRWDPRAQERGLEVEVSWLGADLETTRPIDNAAQVSRFVVEDRVWAVSVSVLTPASDIVRYSQRNRAEAPAVEPALSRGSRCFTFARLPDTTVERVLAPCRLTDQDIERTHRVTVDPSEVPEALERGVRVELERETMVEHIVVWNGEGRGEVRIIDDDGTETRVGEAGPEFAEFALDPPVPVRSVVVGGRNFDCCGEVSLF